MNFNSKVIKIDSGRATQYQNEFKTAFIYSFDSITTYAHQSIIYSVLNCSIPYSFYAVNKYNQYLDIEEKINNQTTQRTIVIPAGNYSAIDFSKTLKTLLNNPNITYEIEYNKINNRYLISITTPNATAIFKFRTGENNNESCYKFLGLIKEDLIINNVPLLSMNSIIMNDISYLQIRSDLGNNILSSSNEDNIIEVIPINAVPYGYISYTPHQPNKYLLSSKTLSNIYIQLLDNNNNLVNLNGLSFLITIKIDLIDNDENKIPYAIGRGQPQPLSDDVDKTNLQIIEENPGIINTPAPQEPWGKAEAFPQATLGKKSEIFFPNEPLTLSSWIDYQNIKKMLRDLEKEEKRKLKTKQIKNNLK